MIRAGLALLEGAGRDLTGEDLLDDHKASLGVVREVARPDGVTVHQGLVEGGEVDVGGEFFGQSESESIKEGHLPGG